MFHVFHEGEKRLTYHDLKKITLFPFVVVVVVFFRRCCFKLLDNHWVFVKNQNPAFTVKLFEIVSNPYTLASLCLPIKSKQQVR